MILAPVDQRVRDAGFNFVPFNRFLASPFQIPQDDTVTTDPNTGAGIVTLQPSGGGRDDVKSYESFTPDFSRRGVFADPKEYGPGGMYEINPAALGFEFGPQGQVMRAGPMDYMQGQLAASSTNPQILSSNLDLQMNRVAGIPLREIADMYDARMQQVPGQDFRNFLKRFTGAGSNFEVARVPGMIEQLPGITGLLSKIGAGGDRSDTSRFAVDDAGYGVGTQRDQFGVFTGGKTLFGKTANYTERMKNEIADIAKNFGYSEDDLLGLDPATLAALGARNKFRQTQVIDYVNKLRAKDIEAKYAKEQAELDRQNKLEKQRAKTREADRAAGAFDDKVRLDPGGGGTFKEQTAAKERQGVQVAGPGFGKGAYFMDGGIVDMLEIYD